jgi:hypothetical protein
MELFSSQLLKGHYFKKRMYVCNWTKDSQGIIDYLGLVLQKNFFLSIMTIHGMTFEFGYLGEFKFIFEKNRVGIRGPEACF